MSNRFSEELLAASHILIAPAIYDVLKAPDAPSTFFYRWWEVTEACPDYWDLVSTMICFFAAFSDEDIDELVINWKEQI